MKEIELNQTRVCSLSEDEMASLDGGLILVRPDIALDFWSGVAEGFLAGVNAWGRWY